MLIAIFFLILLGIGLSIVIYSLRYGISPMPTSNEAKKIILNLIPQNTKGKIFELGSGWGSLAFPLAHRFSHCQIDAYEISPFPWFISKFQQLFIPFKNLRFIREDFFKSSLSEASVVVCYLYPKAMDKLKIKFEKELMPGTLIISHTFAISGWKPFKVFKLQDLYQTPIYLYKI